MMIKTALVTAALLAAASTPVAAPLANGDVVSVRFGGLVAELGHPDAFLSWRAAPGCEFAACSGFEVEILRQDQVRIRLR